MDLRFVRHVQHALPQYAIIAPLHEPGCERDHYSGCYTADQSVACIICFGDDQEIKRMRKRYRELQNLEYEEDEEGGTVFAYGRKNMPFFKRAAPE